MKQPHVQGSSVVALIGGQRDQATLQKGEAISKQDWAVGVVLVLFLSDPSPIIGNACH